MLVKTHISVAAAYLVLSGCGQPTEILPPLLRDATTTGGSNFLCEGGEEQGSVPETASHSPQIVAAADCLSARIASLETSDKPYAAGVHHSRRLLSRQKCKLG